MHFGLLAANLNQRIRIRILYILKLLHTGVSAKEAIYLLTSWSTWNFEIKCLLYTDFGSMLTNQNKKTRIRTLYILKLLHTGCSTKEAIRLLPFQSTWNFKKSRLLQMHLGLIVVNWNQKTRIRTLSILKLLYTGCSTKDAISLLPSWSTRNFENKCLFYAHFGSMLTNQKKTTRIRTLYILKLLHTGCSSKGAIRLLPSRTTWKFKKSRHLQMHFGLIVAN